MFVVSNLVAMNAQRQFNIVNDKKAKSTEKLSSGYRVNRAADDAAGLAISEKMRRQIRGLNQGAKNIQSGISMMQVADGALEEVHDMLNRVETLAVQAANETLSSEDRGYLQQEVNGIVDEINRIAETTTFNEIQLFDGDHFKEVEVEEGSITKLISSPSADFGYLHEAYKYAGNYYPAAYLDFSAVTEASIPKLNGGSFQFNCSQNCSEVFDIKFTTDGTPSSAKNLSGQVHHYYSVDISKCKNGTEVVDTIYDYVSKHLPSTAGGSIEPGGVQVSHSNNLIKDGNKLVIAANGSSNRYSSEAAAKSKYPNSNKGAGGIQCSEIYFENKIPPKYKRDFDIQCSSNIGDKEVISIYRMNCKTIGVENLNVSTVPTAMDAIGKVKHAHQEISAQRAHIGASQNRLEHSYSINNNVEENTTAAESRIRDTDMAKEMVQNSLFDILSQAGVSMMSQANQINQNVLSLLQ